MELSDQYPIFDFEHEKKTGIKWDHNKILQTLFQDRLLRQPSFARAFLEQYDRTKDFYRDCKKKVYGKIADHLVMEMTGMQGLGKSRAMQEIIKKIFKYINMKNIVFRYEDAIQRCKGIKKNSFLNVDEQVKGSGIGADREKQEIENTIEITRIYGLSLFLCSPTSRNLSSVHYNLEIIQRSVKLRLSKILIKSQTGSILGFIIVKIPKDKDDSFWIKEYEPKKIEFVEKFLSRQSGRIDFDLASKELINHKLWKHAKSSIERRTLATKINPTLTTEEINMIVANITFIKHQGKDI